jgi:putative ABC transport system substrate-binding protein
MNRREFIPLLGGAAAWPITARAQERAKAYRIGTLTASAFERSSHAIKVFEEGMAKLRYTSQSNVIYEHRFAGGRLERLTDLAKELVALNVDVIVAGNNAAISAAKQVTSTVPIVMTYSIDPIGAGFIASFAHPSGNITGLTAEVTAETWGKRFELAMQVVPAVTRCGRRLEPRHSWNAFSLGSDRERRSNARRDGTIH